MERPTLRPDARNCGSIGPGSALWANDDVVFHALYARCLARKRGCTVLLGLRLGKAAELNDTFHRFDADRSCSDRVVRRKGALHASGDGCIAGVFAGGFLATCDGATGGGQEYCAEGGRGDLSPIPAGGLPSEFQPNARAVNLLLDRLRRALEAERSFTANSAHELRTPVAGALAQVQRLIVEASDEKTRSRARQVEAALQRLARLSEKLMQLARAEGGRLQAEAPVDLAPILRMLVAGMGREDGHRIELTLPDARIMASIDSDAFAILARNLIENALRHGAQDAPVQVSLSLDGVLRVVNRGPVVPADVLGRLAQPFERGPTDAHGSGLGLAIVAAIADGTGGRLDLISPAVGLPDGFEARFSMSRAEMR